MAVRYPEATFKGTVSEVKPLTREGSDEPWAFAVTLDQGRGRSVRITAFPEDLPDGYADLLQKSVELLCTVAGRLGTVKGVNRGFAQIELVEVESIDGKPLAKVA